VIERLTSKEEMRATVAAARRENKRVGFVPTMGALHQGHLSLVRAACARTDIVIVSIFVNPTQFAPGEDFERYPRPIDADLAALKAEGVEAVFMPSPGEMYAPAAQVTVEPGPLAERWEGAIRPGHFSGVATVVAKLFNVVRPDLAFFGEKDYQQLRIIKRLTLDLDLGVGIVGCPTVRDSDGLALSSRNAYLSPEDRAAALALPSALAAAEDAVAWGERDPRALETVMRETVARIAGEAVALDYAAVVDDATLEPAETIAASVRALIAGRVGVTRLIDNCALIAPVSAKGDS
jgi:pantoate--beta-alanine ligase